MISYTGKVGITLGEATFCSLGVLTILLDPEEINDLGLLHRKS
jgi:hypothetical protein